MLHHLWTYRVEADAGATVLPDGCRDVLVISGPGRADEVRLTDWDLRPRSVRLTAGWTITGYRLRPGVTMDRQCIETLGGDPEQLEQAIASEARADDEVGAMIEALVAPGATVRSVARHAGVTARTLQRRFHALGLPGPDTWRLLGRARRAAWALAGPLPIADIACASGYSDQAHMTREFVRWFGAPPDRLRRDGPLLRQIRQPGLGNWTGEQISTR